MFYVTLSVAEMEITIDSFSRWNNHKYVSVHPAENSGRGVWQVIWAFPDLQFINVKCGTKSRDFEPPIIKFKCNRDKTVHL